MYAFARKALIYLIVFLHVCIAVALFVLGDFVRAFMCTGMLFCSIFFIHEVVCGKCKEILTEHFTMNIAMLFLMLQGSVFLLLRANL